jgi:predicted dehydrogenase
MNIGIIATGRMAGTAADTLSKMQDAKCIAVASRTIEKAQAFAKEHGIERAYGSYSELLNDKDVDLVYVATPHSMHYDITMEALRTGKPCLVEKAFMANHRQSKEVIDLAHKNKVFVAEAIWTRYQPAVEIVREMMKRIGTLRLISANIGYNMVWRKPKLLQPELCGGALMDVGVYGLNFVRMFCEEEVTKIGGCCTQSDTGMDLSEVITLSLANGVMATIQATANATSSNRGVLTGTEGFIVVDNINNPQLISLYAPDRTLVEDIHVPQQITGYEYEFSACKEAIENHQIETAFMPHDETLRIMQLMDTLREQWGVRFPMD